VTRSTALAALTLALAGPLGGQPPAAPMPPKPAAPAANPDVEKAFELFRQNKVPDALELLKKAAKANPALPQPKLQLAQWCLQANSGQAARQFIEQAIAEDRTHVEGYVFNGNVAFNEGRVTEAILNLQTAEAMAQQPRWDAEQKKRFLRDIRNGLASCFSARGDFDAAKEYLRGMLNDDPKNGGLRQRLAEVVFRTGKPAEAFDELTRAFADDPTLDPPDLRMAALWQAKSAAGDPAAAAADRQQAEEYYKKAVTAHAKNAKCHREYAVWLMEDGRTDAAGLYVEAMAKIDPAGRDTAAAKALWHLHRKEYAAAEPLLEGMMKDAPGDSFATGYLCVALAESGDEKKQKRAIELAETMVRQNQRAPLPYAILGWSQFKAGKVDDADKALGVALSTGQVTLDTAYYLAKLLAERQKFEDAHRFLKDAVAAPHGLFVYRIDAKAWLPELAKKLPEKKDEPKK
jgi:tetratricopeptide (TPR) repeat protein